ncbi:phenylalanine--tRNA ligase subunit beta [Microbacterium amylolyticum]|uniref:Phenylalanine--tRNA ligase beta subunit n=1 Tax=Microbacterium amylolyticum TaxID=936337 RepID=A0ABS4ZFR2_9MICO|nr:phenylalanine--tRNA ligase subunit beta [Microbacterium amylolyticum]MBP2436116.1 phenylalanyl-tRNA synthetase beta chain [Microbacterium amylolyticum]
MRIPLSWLREYVAVPGEATADDVFETLVSVGFEEEEAIGFDVTGPVVVGQVVSFDVEPQKNGKNIRWCQVDVGEAHGGVRGVVCGAQNFHPGDKVVVTLPGAVLPGPFPIAARKTYGHTSDGMIAAAGELGLTDDADGIIRLSEWGLDPEVGSDAIALLGLDDVAVDVNVTPDRGYALSIRGIAREYALATGAAFSDPADRPASEIAAGDGFPLTVRDDNPIRGEQGVKQFVLRTVTGVDPTRPTPTWMRARLQLAGLRSLGLLVDITNYVMLELGNPIHGYDADRLTGGITVRRAAEGEKLTTLDGTQRVLSDEDLLITDESGPIGLAGVMGGETTELSGETTNVVVEAATFESVSIARTARRHKLPSEASKRFERGVDPLVARAAAQRVVDLMVDLAGGTAGEQGASLDDSFSARTIHLPDGFVAGLIGVDYAPERIREILEAIGCRVETSEGGFAVSAPSWRPDIEDKWSLAEEVARVDGLDKVPSILPIAPSGRGYTREQQARRTVANSLAAAGLVEVQAFPFVKDEENALHGSASGEVLPSVRLQNALDQTRPYLRRSLIPGLLHVAHRNLSRGTTDLSLFEIGNVFLPEPGVTYGTSFNAARAEKPSDEVLAQILASIPPQPRHVALLFAGDVSGKQPGHAAEPAGLSVAIDAVRTIASAAGVDISVSQGERAALHPGRTGVLTVRGEEVGYVGELLPQVAKDADLMGRVTVAELDLDRVIALAGERVTVSSLSTFPAATQDVSLVLGADVPAAAVRDALTQGAGDLLERVSLVDDYRGQGIDEGQKSLTFALRFRAADRTLTAAEATEAKLAGVAVTEQRFGARIRD